jgi:hypothetical protein
MRVTHFAIREVAACAYLLGRGASVDLMQGDVESVPVGACMQIDGYDTSRLHNDVVIAPRRAVGHGVRAPGSAARVLLIAP